LIEMMLSVMKYHLSFILWVIVFLLLISCGSPTYDMEFSDSLRLNIENLQRESVLLDGQIIYSSEIVIELYNTEEEIIPAKWDSRENIGQLLYSIRNVYRDGLRPEDYHLSEIEDLLTGMRWAEEVNTGDSARLELLLTDAFLLLAAHLAGGKTRSDEVTAQWRVSEMEVAIGWEAFLHMTLAERQVVKNLERLTPEHRKYTSLKEGLEKYRWIEAQGGWERFTTDLAKLEKGMEHPDIGRLRERLAITQGPAEYDTADINLFDDSLHEQVVLFQKRKGLEPDGVLEGNDLEIMNVPVYDRISSIETNLERLRERRYDPDERYIVVNIPDFMIQVMEDGRSVLTSRAIAGTPERSTPAFSSLMTYLVMNPYWLVPPRMLQEDIIPSVVDNIYYLEDSNMEVLDENWEEVDPMLINWEEVDSLLRERIGDTDNDFEDILDEVFPYAIRQKPGPDNEMGRIKFMFPNPHYVNIHDTPHTHLFEPIRRTFSSGCIRTDKAFELAAYLLEDDPGWTMEHILEVTDQKSTKEVWLEDPIEVHILYLTAWAEDDGLVYFRDDIYNLDRELYHALKQDPPHEDS